MNKLPLFLMCFLLLSACRELVEPILEPIPYEYEFRADAQDWLGDFADYPAGEEAFYELEYEHSTLPSPLVQAKGALRQSGNNHSDDLFMFIKRKITGLTPNQSYKVTFDIKIATNAPNGSVGIGGSPAENVYIKAGVTRIEPQKELDVDNYYRMNIDKGNQSTGGRDMSVIGDFPNGSSEFDYRLKDLTHQPPFEIVADANGEFWAIIGTDSGFEGTTTIYYSRVLLTIE